MKVRLTLVNDSGCELDTVETDTQVRDGQFSAQQITWKITGWELQHGDTIRVSIPDVAAQEG